MVSVNAQSPAGRAADILAAKQLAPACQHLLEPCSDRFGVHALRCAGVPARREKIRTLADTESGAGTRGDRRAPGPVRHDDRPGCVEHTDFTRQRIEGTQNEAARTCSAACASGSSMALPVAGSMTASIWPASKA